MSMFPLSDQKPPHTFSSANQDNSETVHLPSAPEHSCPLHPSVVRTNLERFEDNYSKDTIKNLKGRLEAARDGGDNIKTRIALCILGLGVSAAIGFVTGGFSVAVQLVGIALSVTLGLTCSSLFVFSSTISREDKTEAILTKDTVFKENLKNLQHALPGFNEAGSKVKAAQLDTRPGATTRVPFSDVSSGTTNETTSEITRDPTFPYKLYFMGEDNYYSCLTDIDPKTLSKDDLKKITEVSIAKLELKNLIASQTKEEEGYLWNRKPLANFYGWEFHTLKLLKKLIPEEYQTKPGIKTETGNKEEKVT